MQEKIYVRAVLIFILVLLIAVIHTWYPILFDKEEQASEVIPVSINNTSHLADLLVCERGQLQSPIDINVKSIQSKGEKNIQFHYKPTLLKIYDGHNTIHASVLSDENYIKIGKEIYNLVDIHFHNPSEHTINGKYFDLEMHLVHENTLGENLVVAALFKEGDENELLNHIFGEIQTDMEHISKEPIDLSKVIKANSVYNYVGSLTTPPCTEGVEWLVLKDPFELSKDQLTEYTKQYPQNNRPIQQLNNREIKQIIINE